MIVPYMAAVVRVHIKEHVYSIGLKEEAAVNVLF
jgi:hypothetical protein